MVEQLKQFLTKDILSFGEYRIDIADILLIVPIIFLNLLIRQAVNSFLRKKDLLKKGYVKTVLRIFKWIIHFFTFLGIMLVIGVKVANILDFIGAVLSFKLFTIADTDISLITIIVITIVVFISAKLARVVRNYFYNKVFPRFRVDEGVMFSLSKLIGYAVVAIGIIIALQGLGIRLAALTVFAGVLGVGIGFGMQNITANIVSGIVILFERPIKEGDMIRLSDTIGEVKKISLRATVIQTIYNEHLIVPNSEFINSVVENMSYGDLRLRIRVKVGVAYGTDPFMVKDALIEAARRTENVLEHPEPIVFFKEFGDSSLNFELLAWIDSPGKRFTTESELHFSIVGMFNEKGIKIPFPQRDVYIKQMPGNFS